MDAPGDPPDRIDLANEPDFALGRLLVMPSACRVVVGGEHRSVQRRVMEVLAFLAAQANRTVTRDDLTARCWGQKVVGEDAVNRVIAKVRDLARGVEPAPFVLETIPRVGFRFVVTPSGSGPDGSAPLAPGRSGGGRAIPRRGLVAAVLGLLLAGAVGVSFWRFWVARPDSPAVGRVDVAAFAPLQADPTLRRFSVEISEALLRRLAEAGVEARPNASPAATARAAAGAEFSELGLGGSIDRDGDAYVVAARMDDRRTGRVLWSGRFERPQRAAVAFPEEAANAIADVLGCGLQRRAAAHATLAPPVFGLVLSYCEARRETPSLMLEIARRLVAAAPGLSIAHSMEAAAAGREATESDSPIDASALRALARAAAARALQLDPGNGESFYALALSQGEGAHWLERERDLQRASALEPGFLPARNVRVFLLREVGRLNEALDLTQADVAADPARAAQLEQMAMMNAARGDADGARGALARLDLIDPAFGRDIRWTLAFWWGDGAAARATVRALAPAGDRACIEPYLDRLGRAEGVRPRGLPAACSSFDLDWRVRMLAREGDLDGAYAELARASASPNLTTIFLFYPEMKAFRDDPRFMPYARRRGLVDYWTRSGHWPDFCSEPDLPRPCRAAAG